MNVYITERFSSLRQKPDSPSDRAKVGMQSNKMQHCRILFSQLEGYMYANVLYLTKQCNKRKNVFRGVAGSPSHKTVEVREFLQEHDASRAPAWRPSMYCNLSSS